MIKKIKNINYFYFLLPVIIPRMKPITAKTIMALVAVANAWGTENELLIRSQIKNTRPPNTPINTAVNIAYFKSTPIRSLLIFTIVIFNLFYLLIMVYN